MLFTDEYIKKQIAVYQANQLEEKRLANAQQRPGRGTEGNLSYGPYLLISREGRGRQHRCPTGRRTIGLAGI